MVLFRQCSIGPFDCAVIGVRRDAKDFVVIFGFAAFQKRVSLLEEGLYVLGSRMVLFGEIEGADGCFEIFGIKLAVCLRYETGKRVGIQGESFVAVGRCFLLVDLESVLVQRSYDFEIQAFMYLSVALASHLNQTTVEIIRRILVYIANLFEIFDVLSYILHQPWILDSPH